jgi:hypothetical protein
MYALDFQLLRYRDYTIKTRRIEKNQYTKAVVFP